MARFANDKFSILSRRFGSKQSLADLSIYDYNNNNNNDNIALFVKLHYTTLLARLSILPDGAGWVDCGYCAVLGLEDPGGH